jgi:hypothetical protein
LQIENAIFEKATGLAGTYTLFLPGLFNLNQGKYGDLKYRLK